MNMNKEQLNSLINLSINSQQKEIEQQKAQLSQLQSQPKQMDLTPLAALADAWSGQPGLARAYQAMKPQDNTMKIQGLQQQLMQQEQGLIGDRLSQLKTLTAFEKDKNKAEKGKNLTASAVSELADIETQFNSVDEIFTDWKSQVEEQRGRFGRVGSLASRLNPGSSENVYNDSRRLKAQVIGKALEGGKLTDVDYEKYLKFVPELDDTEKQAKSKLTNLQKELSNRYNTSIKSYSKGGFDVENFSNLNIKEDKATKKSGGNKDRLKELEEKYGL